MRHRHVNKLGFLLQSKAGSSHGVVLQWRFDSIAPGSVSYRCMFAPSQGEPDIVLTPDETRGIRISSDGLLHGVDTGEL